MAARGPSDRDMSSFRNYFRDFPDYNIRLTNHARQRMEQREIRLPQIRRILGTGTVREVERDIRTGRDLQVVVTLGPGRRVTVVTAI